MLWPEFSLLTAKTAAIVPSIPVRVNVKKFSFESLPKPREDWSARHHEVTHAGFKGGC
jgi:hypothetical protein